MSLNSYSKSAYVILANQLKKRLDDRMEERLPTFREISKEYNVTLGVVQRAMKLLENEGIVQTQRSIGSRRLTEKVDPELRCYGLLHPHSSRGNNELVISMNLLRAFEELNVNAVPLIRSCGDDSKSEREIAQRFSSNPLIDGLLVSPCIHTTNGDIFEEIAKSKPVVVIDNPIEGVDLPTLVFDYEYAGSEIGREFRRLGRKKTLVLLDRDLNNHSIAQLVKALENEIPLEICHLPLFQIESDCKKQNYESYKENCIALDKLLLQSDCDSVFSPFDTHFEKIFINGIREWSRSGMVSAVICSDYAGWYSEEFGRSGVMMWQYSMREMFLIAASRLLNWKRSHERPHGLKKIKLDRIR